MSAPLYESIARIAQHAANARAIAAIGRVTSIMPTTAGSPDYAVSVELRDSGLVLPRVPLATSLLGAVALPAVDELVVVIFLEGDVNAPVVVGRLYHAEGLPPEHQAGQVVLALPAGEAAPKLTLKIEGAAPSIALELPDSEVAITIVGGTIRLQVGGMQLSLESGGGGRAELKAGGATITLKQDGEVSLETPGKLKLKGTEVEIAGTARVAVSGALVEIN